METTSAIHRNSVFGFLALAVLVLVGFWQTYFSQLGEAPIHAHAHGTAMSLWCLLLIAQAYLIRTGRRDVHRQLGKVSYVLAPVIVITTLSFAHVNLESDGLTPDRLYILYIQLHLLVLFVVAYSFAIYRRNQQTIHMRLMICTALPMIDPALARIILTYIWEPPSFAYIQAITYSVTDLILVGLIVANWKREIHLKVYPAMLVLFIVLHVPNFFIEDVSGWASFAQWFSSLPLS